MSNFVIGDLQGYYAGLQRLLEKIKFDPRNDQLYFVGDLVNRGPQSLATLNFLYQIQKNVRICLGNHDLYLLQHLYSDKPQGPPEELQPILQADHREELGHWLRQQDFLIETSQACIVHAGIEPTWNLTEALSYQQELTEVLKDTDLFKAWMNAYFSPRPARWDPLLTGLQRWQLLADIFTRMRFVKKNGTLDFSCHLGLSATPNQSYPWFAAPKRQNWHKPIIFGHWASLLGKTGLTHFHNIDTGFHWGGTLTALNLDNFQSISTF